MFRVNGFYGHIKHHGFRSILLFGLFLLAAEIVGLLSLCFPAFFIEKQQYHPLFDFPGYVLKYGTIVGLISVALFLYFWFYQVKQMRRSLDLQEAHPHLHPRLYRVASMLSQTMGMEIPQLWILPSWQMNAFAMGGTLERSGIVVTQGLYDNLDDQELEAVIAHEMVHIANGDSTFMAIANSAANAIETLYNFKWLGPLKYLLIPFAIMMPTLLVFYFLFCKLKLFGKLMAFVTRLLISSSREFIADAEAVRLTHNPAALASALRKLENRSKIEGLAPTMDAMMIDGDAIGSHATHPTVGERIAKLARFSGSMMHDRGFVGASGSTSFASAGQTAGWAEQNNFGHQSQCDNVASPPAFGKPSSVREWAMQPVDGQFGKRAGQGFGQAQVKVAPSGIFDRVSQGGKKEKGLAGLSFRKGAVIFGGMIFGLSMCSNYMSGQVAQELHKYGASKEITAALPKAKASKQAEPSEKTRSASKPSVSMARTQKGVQLSLRTYEGRRVAVVDYPNGKRYAFFVGLASDQYLVIGLAGGRKFYNVKNTSTGKLYVLDPAKSKYVVWRK